MNTIRFSIKKIIAPEVLNLHGITFSDIQFIEAHVDGINVFDMDFFDGSFIVLSELLKSTEKSDQYLLFTCTCGVADDGGWDYVQVHHSNETISWKIERDNKTKEYTFVRSQYISGITDINNQIKLNKYLILQPQAVIMPE